MTSIDLTLDATDDGSPIKVFVISSGGHDALFTSLPDELLQALEVWRRRFLTHHDPSGTAIGADVVEARSSQLCQALQHWLGQPEWLPLQRLLTLQPGVPLRVRCRPSTTPLARLPWESLPLDRPIWRLPGSPFPASHQSPRPARRPRLLLLIGDSRGLDLDGDIRMLQRLAQSGGLELVCLRGQQSCLPVLARQLQAPRGWDALVYLGHSDADAQAGGRLLLGDGRWLSGLELRRAFEQRPDPGGLPSVVLLNSCLGLDLADSCLAAGIPWAVCFREMVPTHAASLAFGTLLQQLQNGTAVTDAVAMVRQQLQADGPAGTGLLLSVVGADQAPALRLPLRRRRQFWQRLASSTRSQALASASWLVLALAMDLNPSLPPGPALLDQRLEWQRRWRVLTHQPGPQRAPLPVLLLDNGPTADALGVTPTPNRVPRQALVKVLQQVSPDHVPVVGLDLVLDEPAPFTTELAALLQQQQRRRVLAGYFAEGSVAVGEGQQRSRPLQLLRASGLQQVDLSTAIPGPRRDGVFPLPLRLQAPLGEGSFAQAMAEASQPARPVRGLPYDAVIDWSLDWAAMVTNLGLHQLATLQGPVLLIGADGTINHEEPDWFMAPRAAGQALQGWGRGVHRLPGPVVQAVLAQSMAMGHWLTPWLQTPTTAAACGLGVLIAATVGQRRRRWLVLAGVTAVALPLALQLGVQHRILVPVALPLLAVATTTLIRHD